MTIQEKETYLMKAAYDVDDVRVLTEYSSKTKCREVMNLCRTNQYGGFIPGIRGRYFIKAESLWLYLGTTMEAELRKLAIAKGEAQ